MEIFGVKSVTISGLATTYSSAIQTNGYAIQAVEAPTGIASTALNVQVSVDGGNTFQNLINNGSAYTITISGGKTSLVNSNDLLGFTHVRFSPNATENANRVFKVVILDF